MKQIVVDASVVAKWYLIEEYREQALKIRDDYIEGKITLASPTLMPFEVINAIRYSKKKISTQKLKEIAKSIQLYGIQLHELTGTYANLTIETALENNISIYDASYIALAKHLKTITYTADQKLIKTTKNHYRQYVKHISQYKSD